MPASCFWNDLKKMKQRKDIICDVGSDLNSKVVETDRSKRIEVILSQAQGKSFKHIQKVKSKIH